MNPSEQGKRFYSSKNSPNRERFYREQIDSSVVDLRGMTKGKTSKAQLAQSSKKSSPGRGVHDIHPQPGFKRIQRGRLPDEYYAQEYTEALRVHEHVRGEIEFVDTSSDENLSKDTLLRHLDHLDQRDLALQDKLPKEPHIEQAVSAEPTSVPRAEVASDKIDNFNFLSHRDAQPQNVPPEKISPRSQPTKEEVLHIRPKRRSKKKFFLFLFFMALIAAGILIAFEVAALKSDVAVRAESAFTAMRNGEDALRSLDSAAAQDNFVQAQGELAAIHERLGVFGRLLEISDSVPFQSQLSSLAHLLAAGDFFARAGHEAAVSLALMQGAQPNSSETYLTDTIVSAGLHLRTAQQLLEKADLELIYVREQDIPEQFRSSIRLVQKEINHIHTTFTDAFSSMDLFLTFLGHHTNKNYLFLFQNSSELRATGGFIGTYGLVTVQKGQINELFVNGIYDPDGQLTLDIIPPQPLQYVTPNWGTRDANWFFDFPTSAEKVVWFYERTGSFLHEVPAQDNPPLDGVIAITPRVVEKLLELVGPVEMPLYGVTLTHENFLDLVQNEVEHEYDRELNKPKQILADLTPFLIERIPQLNLQGELLDLVLTSLEQKDILVYSRDSDVQEFLSARNWSGEISRSPAFAGTVHDYLAVVVSNIGGGKTDKLTDTAVDTVTTINQQGEVLRTVIISRTHNGGASVYPWYNKPNYSYLRVYVPRGATLVEAKGFAAPPTDNDIDYAERGFSTDSLLAAIDITRSKDEVSNTDIFEESGKTVFGNWFWVEGGEQHLAQLTYKLPTTLTPITREYMLTIQKQSGIDINYSGAIEEWGDSFSLGACASEATPFVNNQFEFTHVQDVEISCEISQL